MVRKDRRLGFLLSVLLVWLCAPVIQAQEKPVKLYVGVAGYERRLSSCVYSQGQRALQQKYGLDVELIFFSEEGTPGDSMRHWRAACRWS